MTGLRRLSISVLLLVPFGGGCTALFGPVPCERDEHCPDGQVCTESVCAVGSADDDAGSPPADAGDDRDAGADGGTPPVDGGVDGGTPPVDGGVDGGDDPTDAGGDAGADAGPNEPPTVVGETLTLAEDTSDTLDVLANDIDPEGETLTLVSVTPPQNGEASFTGEGTVTYTPDADYFGADQLIYEVSDERGATQSGTLDITVTPVDDVPLAPPATWFVAIDAPLTDFLPGVDVDGDTLTWEPVPPNPVIGTVDVIGATGEATYTPTGTGGSDSFGYRVNDGTTPSPPGLIDVIVLDKTWTGAVSNDWETADNWSPVGVPGSGDAVWLKAGAQRDPVLGKDTAIRGLLLDEGIFLELVDFDLTLTGSFRTPPPTAAGGITGTGTIVFGTTVTAARGTVPRLDVSGDATLDGELVVTDTLTIPKDGVLRLGQQHLEVRGTTYVLYDSNNTGLVLTDPAARADLLGDATFDGENDAATGTATMTAGEIWVHANLTTIDTANNPKTLSPFGTTFVFAGTSPQTLTFERPSLAHTRLHDVHIVAGANVQLATNLVVDGLLTMEPGAQLTGARVEYAGVLPQTEAGYAVATSAVVADVTMAGNADVYGDVVVEPGMRVDVGPWSLRARGDLELRIAAAADGLFMEDAAGQVTVEGEAWWKGTTSSAGSNNRLLDGTLRLHGDLRQTYISSSNVFYANGTDTVLEGAGLQTVRFDSPASNGSRFSNLRIENAAGVQFATAAWVVGDVEVVAGSVVDIVQSLDVDGGFAMLGPAAVDGTGVVRMKSDVPNTAIGYDILTQVDGAATLSADRVFHGALLDVRVTGSLSVAGHRLELMGDYQQTTDGSNDGLLMSNAADEVIVHGNVEMRCDSSSGSTLTRFTAGTLRVAGDFAQVHTSTDQRSFIAAGTLVVLDGLASQTVSFTSPGTSSSRFASLAVENPTAVTFATEVFLTDGLRVADGASLVLADVLHIEGDAVWSGAATGLVSGAGALHVYSAVPTTPAGTGVPVWVAGNTTLGADVVVTATEFGPIPDAQLRLNGYTLEVVGDFKMTIDSGPDGLYLNDANDELLVRGDAEFFGTYPSGNTTGHLTAGRIIFEGSFAQTSDWTSDDVFVSTGTAVLFRGTGVHTLSLVDPYESSFRDLEIAAGTTLQAQTTVEVTGALTIGGIYEVPTSTTTSVTGDLVIEAGGELNNQGVVNYSGSYTNSGTLTGNAPMMN